MEFIFKKTWDFEKVKVKVNDYHPFLSQLNISKRHDGPEERPDYKSI